jgi:antitoxin component YwqK of YwqJK toxin-antitoxin module
MKKLLSILSIFLVFISCSPDRVHTEDLYFKGDICYLDGKEFTGISFDIHSNGQLKFERSYKNGRKNGLNKQWFENGQLRIETNYKNGKRDGLDKMWYENGQLNYVWKFKDGVEDGIQKTWYENGQLLAIWEYKDGVLISEKRYNKY